MLSHELFDITQCKLLFLISQIKHNFSSRPAITLVEEISTRLEEALFDLVGENLVVVVEAV